MIKNAVTSFKPAFANIFRDKVNFILTAIPVLIGIILFILLGSWVYGDLMEQARLLVSEYVSEGAVGSVITYITMMVMTVLLYFVFSWTFVLIVAVISSPFNDVLSRRTEKILKGEELETLVESFSLVGKGFVSTIFNEIKKISFIILLSLISLAFSFIPLLTPISVFITVLLLAVQFVDYSWARHGLTFNSCFKDMKSNLVDYGLGGGFFFLLVSVPIINLIVPPVATSYFTILWVKNNEHSN
jgi:CysZ protein